VEHHLTSQTPRYERANRSAGSITRRLGAASLAAIMIFTNSYALAAESCEAQSDDLVGRIGDLKDEVGSMLSAIQSDYASATSKDYSQKLFDAFNNLNKSVKEAPELINQTYALDGFTAVMSEGQIQTKLPPVVTNTMGNAVELAQAAMDEENTKLDLAELRCSQSTEDAALSAFLDKADKDTVSTYQSTKLYACKAVHILASLQDMREKLNDIRENGYPLFYLHKKDKKTFAGQYKRTVQYKVDLRMFPIYPDSKMGVDGKDQPILLGQIDGIDLSYNSYFKWSDDNWTKLNLYQYFIGDSRKEGGICVPALKMTSSVSVQLCLQVKEVDTKNSTVTIKTSAKFKYKGDSHSISFGDKKIPAPFGYLADLSDMKEKKMQDLQSKVADKIASHMGKYADIVEKAQGWQKSCS